MRLGLGLGMTTPRGGDPVDRALSGFKHVYDARKGSAFTDYGTGGANGTSSGTTHSGKWWTLSGVSGQSYIDLFPKTSITLGASDAATFVIVFRRAAASNPAATRSIFSYKDGTSAASVGTRLVAAAGGTLTMQTGDGTDQVTKDGAGPVTNNTLQVAVMTLAASVVELWVNGTQVGDSSRGSVDGASPVVYDCKVGATPTANSNNLDGDVGLVAAVPRRLLAAEIATLTSTIQAAWA